MSSEVFKLGIAQMTSGDDLSANLAQVEKFYSTAGDAQLVVFPENTLFFRIQSGSKIPGLDFGGPEVQRLRALVDREKRALMLTTPLRDGERLKNSTLLFQPGRAPEVVYNKIHLFDVDVPGAPPVRESEVFSGGEQSRLLEIDGWKFGLSICYDLRFSELYLRYAQAADVILVPSAFLVPTGQAHWHTLLKARAIEAQTYVAAPTQAGEHRSASGQTRHTYGHSLVVGPWGEVLMDLENGPEVRLIELKRSSIDTVRRQIPMKSHRRLKPV
jgi:predicted amidohydrolase